jgi:hypothetical protein
LRQLKGADLRVFKTREFVRFARKAGIDDQHLCEAIGRAERGLVDADLGGAVIKQRVARPGQGRSVGFRALIAFRSGTRAIFIYGFAKSDRDNVTDHELAALRRLAEEFLGYRAVEVDALLRSAAWTEVICHG